MYKTEAETPTSGSQTDEEKANFIAQTVMASSPKRRRVRIIPVFFIILIGAFLCYIGIDATSNAMQPWVFTEPSTISIPQISMSISPFTLNINPIALILTIISLIILIRFNQDKFHHVYVLAFFTPLIFSILVSLAALVGTIIFIGAGWFLSFLFFYVLVSGKDYDFVF